VLLGGAAEEEKRARYGPKLAQWMAAYPRERLHILQYEALVSKQLMGGVLGGLKGFLEVDPHLPSDTLPLTNWKHMRGNPDAVTDAALSPNCGLPNTFHILRCGPLALGLDEDVVPLNTYCLLPVPTLPPGGPVLEHDTYRV
jgi:hypothetical protein